MLTVNVIATEPSAGMENVPKAGVVSPTLGLTVAGRVAPPFRTTPPEEAKLNPTGRASETPPEPAAATPAPLVTVIEYVAVVPVAVLVTVGVLVDLAVESAGMPSGPEGDPGLAPTVVVRVKPAPPSVDP